MSLKKAALKKYRIRVFIGSLLMIGGTGGIFGNCTGVLFSAIIKDMGFSSQSLSLYYTIKTLVAGFSITLLTKLYMKTEKLKAFCIFFSVLFALSYGCMYFYTVPYYWYISGFVAGLAGIVSSIQPYILKNWFGLKMTKYIGPSYMMTGVFSMIYNPILSAIITKVGWRNAALISGVIGLSFMTVAAFLLIKKPQDVGLDPDEIEPWEIKTTDTHDEISHIMANHRYPLRKYRYVFFCIIGGSMGYQMATYIPQYTNLLGYELAFGALLSSVIMFGNLGSKFFIGMVNEKIGVRQGYTLYTAIVLAGLVIFLVFGTTQILMMLAALLMGFSYAIGATAWSALAMEEFDRYNFEIPYSKLVMTSNIYFSVIIYLLGLFYDISGNFRIDFIMSIGLCSLSFLLLLFGKRKKNKKAE